jgi:hypothetical protein
VVSAALLKEAAIRMAQTGAPDDRGISPARVTYGVDMGVFARLLRRSKAREEASTAETQADIATAEPAAEEAAEAKGSTDATAEAGTGTGAEGETQVEPQAEVGETAAAKDTDGSTATEAVEDAGTDSVEIPKQQSADEAADHEAGEGART